MSLSEEFVEDKEIIYSSVTGRKWKEKSYDLSRAINYGRTLGVDQILTQILVNRTSSIEEAINFLDSKIKNTMPNPFVITDMEKACNKIIEAIENNCNIVIFGDYDVDGAVSSSLLKNFFSSIGKDVDIFIPNRFLDGYGPSIGAFAKLKEKNCQLIITVDCGSMAHEAMLYAKENNMEVIITDHHQVDKNLPDSFALVNPNRHDDSSGLGYLAGCGVAFMLAVGICKKLKEQNSNFTPPNLFDLLDLVALGTVCDVVPLVLLNRAFVKQGLKVMQETKNLGLKTMLNSLQKDHELDSFTLGYILGPRINAGGRVGESSLGARLLTSQDENEVNDIFNRLNELNEERKKIELGIFDDAMNQAEAQKTGVILVHSANWHQGVIGIVASRLKEKYNKPALVIAMDGEKGKGSCRSVKGFDIGAAIIEASNKGLIVSGGGHQAAAGLNIMRDQIDSFHNWLNLMYEENKYHIEEQNTQFFDAFIIPDLINDYFYDSLSNLKPFGAANESPKFLIKNARVFNVKVFAEHHLMFNIQSQSTLGHGGSGIRAKAFRASDSGIGDYLINNLNIPHSFIVSIKKNSFYSTNKIEVIVEDVIL
jgi:single-stranded-DNA-specific exonuclease